MKRRARTRRSARPRPAQQRAEEFLRRVVARIRAAGRSRLPTVAQLSAQARVGPVALSRALAKLVDEGLVEARPGLGIVLAGAVRENTDAGSDTERAWERARRELAAMVSRSELGPGDMLPSVKQLCARFGVSYPSLRRALSSLCAEKLIQPHLRGFRVPDLPAPRSAATVLLITVKTSDSHPSASFPRHTQVLWHMEEECVRHGMLPRMLPYDVARGTFTSAGGAEAIRPGNTSVLGILVTSMGTPSAAFEPLYYRLVETGKPVAILDDGGGVVLPGRAPGAVRLIRFADTRSDGAAVARYLVGLGHRSVAYLSPTHAALWSQERLAGIRGVYEAAGLGAHVLACCDDSIRTTSEAVGPGQSARAIVEHAARSLSASRAEADRMVGHMLQRMRERLDLYMEPEILAQIEAPLFEQALATGTATAWVCSSDYVASRALQFLAQKRVAVPETVSVMGFDDSLDAFTDRITSYNFNIAMVVRTMLNHVLGPVSRRDAQRGAPPLVVEGFVTERETTRRRSA